MEEGYAEEVAAASHRDVSADWAVVWGAERPDRTLRRVHPPDVTRARAASLPAHQHPDAGQGADGSREEIKVDVQAYTTRTISCRPHE